MRVNLSSAAICVLITGVAAPAGSPKEPHAEVLSLSVSRLPMLFKDKDAPYELRVSSGEGAALALAVYLPGRFPVGLDVESSRILPLRDDKGTDLPLAKAWAAERPDVEVTLASRHEAVLVRLKTTRSPARGARELHLRADLDILCGADQRKDETKPVALRKDNRFEVGGLAIRVTRAEKHSAESPFPFPEMDKKDKKASPETAVTLAFPTDQFDRIQSIEWLDAKGKPITARIDSRFLALEVSVGYILSGEVSEARLRVTWYPATNKVRVPIDLKVGLGL